VQWREAAVNLGANTWQYWTQVAVPLLRPAFLGSALLLFANAFAAYATAAALVSQGSPITPLLIRTALTSEVVLGQTGLAFALALEMIVVAIVMGAYALLLQRTSRWMR
jgi:putative spermidine/putrescine transport system permease protein